MNRLKLSLELTGYGFHKAQEFTRGLPDEYSEKYGSYIEAQKWDIFNFLKDNNNRYASFLGNANIKKWDDVPILTKSVLKQNIDSWITSSFDKSKLFHNHTSGSSSGQPFHIYKDKRCHAITWSEIVRLYVGLAGIEIGRDKYGRFMGISPDSNPYKSMVKDWFANRITYDTFKLEPEMFRRASGDILSHKIKYLYGYASALAQYARYLSNNPAELLKVRGRLLAVIVTSEMCRNADFKLIHQVFGVPVFNEYGCSEFGVLAVGPTIDKLLLHGRHLWVEVVDENGRTLPNDVPGRIVVTSFFNYAFPFIRFDIGDIGAIHNEEGRRYLTNLQGRSSERFEIAGGTEISVLSVEFAIDQIYDACPDLMEYQLAFLGPDSCEFRFVAGSGAKEETKDRIKRILHDFMGERQRVDVLQVVAIPKGAAGKSKNMIKLY